MFSYFEPNLIEKFFWGSGFSNFGHVKMEISIGPIYRHFETVNVFETFFCWFMVVSGVGLYRYGASSVPKFLWKSSF